MRAAGLSLRRPFLILCGWVVASTACADVWTVKPEFSLEESLTDNVKLVAQDRHSDLISVLSPGLSLQRAGRRLNLHAYYQLQGIFYRHFSDDNRTVNLVNAGGTAEMLAEHLFVDAGATSSERNVNNVGAITLDNTSLGDTRGKVDTFRISPYWRQVFGDMAEAELRYERNSVRSDASLDSDSDVLSLEMQAGHRFTRLLWDARFFDEDISGSPAQTARFRNAAATLHYLLTEKFSLKTTGGYDDNEYANRNRDTQGYHWRIGAVYKPSGRTSFEAAAGERYFGRDVLLELSHRHRKFHWRLAYNRQPDTPRTLLLEQPVFPRVDAFGETIADPFRENRSLQEVILPTQTLEVFIRSRLEGAFNYSFRNNSLDISLFGEKRESQLSDRTEKVDGTNVVLTRRINSRTVARVTLLASRDRTASVRDRDILMSGLSLSRTLAEDMQADLTWRYTDVNSTAPGESYYQNSITVSLRKQF